MTVTAEPAAPTTTGAIPEAEVDPTAPSMEEARSVVGDVPIPCDINGVHPCTVKHPEPAKFLIVWADCNCDPLGKDYEATAANCLGDFEEFAEFINNEDHVHCPACDFLYRPAHRMIKAVVFL